MRGMRPVYEPVLGLAGLSFFLQLAAFPLLESDALRRASGGKRGRRGRFWSNASPTDFRPAAALADSADAEREDPRDQADGRSFDASFAAVEFMLASAAGEQGVSKGVRKMPEDAAVARPSPSIGRLAARAGHRLRRPSLHTHADLHLRVPEVLAEKPRFVAFFGSLMLQTPTGA